MSALPAYRAEYVGLVPISEDRAITELGNSPDNVRRERRETALRDDLATITAKVGHQIPIPVRPYTLDEWQTIRLLRSILRTARVKRTWTDLIFSMTPTQVRQIVDEYGDGYFALGGEQAHSEVVELFGTSLPLGWSRFLAQQARLANLDEVRGQLATTHDAYTTIRLHLVPGQNAILEMIYPEWGPNPNSTGLARRLDAAERIVLLAPEESQRLNRLLNLQARRPLNDNERGELDALLDEHGKRLLDRSISLYGGQNSLETAEARQKVEASLADTLTW